MDDTAGDRNDEQRTSVTIRRAPKFSVFLVVGALVGILAALILTSVFPADPAVGFGATFGYIALYGVPLGAFLGAVVAILLDSLASRRTVEVIAGRLDVHQEQDETVQVEAVQDEAVQDETAQVAPEQGNG